MNWDDREDQLEVQEPNAPFFLPGLLMHRMFVQLTPAYHLAFIPNFIFLSPQLSASFLLTSIRKASSSFDQSTGIGLKWVTENMKITDLVPTRSFMD